MAIGESAKTLGTDLLGLSGRAVTWITTTSKIPFSQNQKFAASLILLLIGFWFVQGIQKKAIKIGLSVLVIYFIMGFFL